MHQAWLDSDRDQVLNDYLCLYGWAGTGDIDFFVQMQDRTRDGFANATTKKFGPVDAHGYVGSSSPRLCRHGSESGTRLPVRHIL